MAKMIQIAITVDEDDLRQIDAVAEVEHRTRSNLIQKILADWLKRELERVEKGN